MRKSWKRLLAAALGVLLCAALIPSVLAAEAENVVTIEFTASDWAGPSNDARFDAYLNKLFYGYDSLRTNSPASLSQTLGPAKYAIEQLFKAEIEKVASGQRTSTKFTVYYSELDISSLTVSDLDDIYMALLADCTSSLYWHDGRLGRGRGLNTTTGTFTINFMVAADYQGGEYEVDPARINKAITAKANADAIISQYASASDVNKLRGYMYEICSRNVYNDDAAAHGGKEYAYLGIDPWQLVYVFDNDPETNVVCEGYSKAFEYLCDKTRFNSSLINCYCVAGDGHMWNIVRMDDGNNYVVDVTWSDNLPSNDYYGNPHVTDYAMFLSYALSGSVQGGYTLTFGTSSNTRSYYLGGSSSKNMLLTYTEEELTIADHAYDGQKYYDVNYDANGGEGAPARQLKAKGTALTLSTVSPTRANADADSFTVTLDPNGGQCDTASLTAKRTTSYAFAGWNTKANGSGTGYAAGGTYTADAAVTLYAQWTGTTSTAAVTLPDASREGYRFLGWAENTNASSGMTGSYTPAGSITLHAVWEAIPAYIVSYDANGGEGAPAFQTKYQGTALTLSTAEPTRADEIVGTVTVTLDPNGGRCEVSSVSAERTASYTFSSWNTQLSGSGDRYAPGGTYSADAAVTLYAQWDTLVTTAAAELPTPVWEDHTFLGWAESSDAASGMTGSYTPSGDTLLYAIWTEAPAIQPPVITGQPQSQTVAEGKTASFTVEAEGEELQYQWQVLLPGNDDWIDMSEQTEPTHSFSASVGQSGSRYRCRVWNAGGEEISSEAKLTVVTKPKITTQPKAVSVKAGKKVTFKVKATGGALKYQWYYLKPKTTKWVKMGGKTKATLSFTASKAKNGYKYRCCVTNAAGTVKSKAVKLTVK